MKLYMFRTVPLSIIRSLLTVHSAMVHVIQVCAISESGWFYYKESGLYPLSDGHIVRILS
jgi:hypothetical protein